MESHFSQKSRLDCELSICIIKGRGFIMNFPDIFERSRFYYKQ